MSVLQPLMLWFLAAAAVPVLIHLYNRRKAVRRQIPTIQFLLDSKRRLARQLKLRQFLLLALRVGVFLLIPLALAKPFWFTGSDEEGNDRLPTATVIIVDDSASMLAITTSGASAYEVAVERAREAVEELDDWDDSALLFTSEAESGRLELSGDRAPVLERLSEHRPTQRRTELTPALQNARDVLLSSPLPQRRIVLITDANQGSFGTSELDDAVGGAAHVQLVTVETPERNLAIVDAGYRPHPSGMAQTYELWATLHGVGFQENQQATVQLSVYGKAAASAEVTLEPGRDMEVVFSHQVESTLGVEPVTFEVAPVGGEGLLVDNTRRLLLSTQRNVDVLLVNGDARTVPYQDELFYLEKALKPDEDSQSTIVPRITTPEGLRIEDIDTTDVIVLADVAKLAPMLVSALESFVERGGGLLVTVGERVDADVYNEVMLPLLPKPLRNVKVLARSNDPDLALKVTHFDKVDFAHQVFKPFALPGGEGLQQLRVFAYMLVEPDAQSEARVLVSYTDGAPALLEKRHGAGLFMLLTTTIDRDWSDLPIQKAFVPLSQRLVQHLARRSEGAQCAAVVGEKRTIGLEGRDVDRVEIAGPGAKSFVLAAMDLRTPGGDVVVPDALGFYSVTARKDGVELAVPELGFVANLDPRESDTTRFSPEKMASLWAGPIVGDDSTPDWEGQHQVGLWPLLLFIALLFLYLETLLGFRRSFLRKLGKILPFRRSSPEHS
ncbi:MAG: hypothetical protein CO108_24725 [Deltaproteobacteria bacterium CG_4_9_14_3_um_filter_63_12]|nr:MAG: hypothetical protein CO108_24725 [Deltaproteobacteria bacterium CG_4_9_14_3_um_filter_63_12]